MTYPIVIITPSHDSASALDHTYTPQGFPSKVHTFSVWSVWHGRADRIIILPMPDHYDEETAALFEKAVQENVLPRRAPGGEVIRL